MSDASTTPHSDSLPSLVRRAEQHFAQAYGRPPRWIVAAPGRVNLIGEHTDYNQGFVLPMAIDRYVVLAADRSADSTIRLYSAACTEPATFSLDDSRPSPSPLWSDYVRGVVVGCQQLGLQCGGLEVTIDSGVPLGGGLSSSAALEVATATLVETVAGQTFDPMQKALTCQKAEHEFAGVPCGIMDQFCAVYGQNDHLMLLDCQSSKPRMVPLAGQGVTILVINSNVKHELTGGEYAQRRQQCESAAAKMGAESLREVSLAQLEAAGDTLDPVLYRRARHVITENDRTLRAADALSAGQWDSLGELMYASHASLRDDYEVSCSELDVLVELAKERGPSNGVFGSRMTGGGFGGCTVSLLESGAVAPVSQAIQQGYRERTGIEPTIFATRPAKGAHVVRG